MTKSDHQSIQDALDGSMDATRFAAFQQRLREDVAFLQLYREYAVLHHCLLEEFEGRAMIGKRLTVKKKSLSPWIPTLAIAAACTVFAVIFMNRPSSDIPVVAVAQAVATFSDDAQWSLNGGLTPTSSQVDLPSGTHVELKHGVMHLQVGDAVKAVIDAPADLTYHHGQLVELVSGQGRFRVNTPGKPFEVKTTTMSVVDLGTEFGVMSFADRPAEVHVMEGKVKVSAVKDATTRELSAGAALREQEQGWESIPSSMSRVTDAMPSLITVWEDSFDRKENAFDGRMPKIGSAAWRVTKGQVGMELGHLEGTDFEAFAAFSHHDDHQALPVMLVTMDVVNPTSGSFHTSGWAGLSFYRDGQELLFFGDGFGEDRTWALDIKQQLPLVVPSIPVTGGRTVTLRYDRSTGQASLHHGGLPLSPAFCQGKIPAGTAFDEIRLSASAGATLAVRSVSVQMGGVSNVQ